MFDISVSDNFKLIYPGSISEKEALHIMKENLVSHKAFLSNVFLFC